MRKGLDLGVEHVRSRVLGNGGVLSPRSCERAYRPELRDLVAAPRRRLVRLFRKCLGARLARLFGPGPAEAAERAYWQAAIFEELARGYRRGAPS